VQKRPLMLNGSTTCEAILKVPQQRPTTGDPLVSKEQQQPARPNTALGFEGAAAKSRKQVVSPRARPKSSGVAAPRRRGPVVRRREDESSVPPSPGPEESDGSREPVVDSMLAAHRRCSFGVVSNADAAASRPPCALAKSTWGLSTKGETDQDAPIDAPIIEKPRRFVQIADQAQVEAESLDPAPPRHSFITEAPTIFETVRLNEQYSLPRGYVRKMWNLFKTYDDQDRGWLPRSDYQLFMRRVAMMYCRKISDASREIVRSIPEDLQAFTFNDFLDWSTRNLFLREWLDTPEDRYVRRLAEDNNVSVMAVEEVKKSFDSFDLDGSGHIEFPEFKALVKTLLKVKQDELPMARMQQFWWHLDEDRSGSIEFAEFLPWYLTFYGSSSWEAGAASATDPVQEFYRGFRYVPEFIYHCIDSPALDIKRRVCSDKPSSRRED